MTRLQWLLIVMLILIGTGSWWGIPYIVVRQTTDTPTVCNIGYSSALADIPAMQREIANIKKRLDKLENKQSR